jgi:hypothetical protein
VRHVRMLGLCLVAVLALGAYAVSSASALEWGKCELAGPGHNYTGPNCTKAEKAKPKGTGEYEWRKASEVAAKREAEGKSAGVPFTGHSIGSGGILAATIRICTGEEFINEEYYDHARTTRQNCAEKEYVEQTFSFELPAIECESESNAGGHTEGKNKVAGVTVTFTGCLYVGSYVCESEGAGPGNIVTTLLKGKLGWINKSTKEVGVVLEPEQKHGVFAEFQCGTELFKVGVGNKKEGAWYVQGENYPEGCGGECPGATPTEEKHGGYDQVISPITPVNQMTSEFTQVYARAAEAPFGNLPHQLEGKHISALEVAQNNTTQEEGEATQWAAASEEITNVNVSEEEGEIKA